MDRAEPIHVQGAMLLGVPTLCGFASDISKIIQTGDTVAIKGDTVTITRRPRDPRSK
jgi:predicted aconitase with swiveling domain